MGGEEGEGAGEVMSWNYRICKQRIHFTLAGKKRQETIYSIREVFYGEPGSRRKDSVGWTDPINIDGCESPKVVVKTLEMMLAAQNRPVLWVGNHKIRNTVAPKLEKNKL